MKNTFRRYFKHQLSLSTSEQEQSSSNSIAQQILNSEFYTKCTHVCCYIPMQGRNEVDTMDIIHNALKRGKQLFIPIVINDIMTMVSLKDELDFSTFKIHTKYKLLEPPIESLPNRENLLDSLNGDSKLLVIVPGLAFDYSNRRLGRGKGHYDTFFEKLDDLQGRIQFETNHVGVCFSCQFIDENFKLPDEYKQQLIEKQLIESEETQFVIPTEKHDKTMDSVVHF
ncbi:predicted protein [Naegleria gruberi]|uniref:5-formyltetrahydrofolate cyclo-ligase n=1 Tax=Naegleria gruberi TaxID=5762 RepID=D2VDM7_NAEGR|nr:uncharacterized protein NAEGRDRAFT_66974 [Naegleria gruberi]EFC45029.1 predicted protein [Naegleria gruberi]|eukprot:XP_002677773.1 predicted protein [Naegleria gruberi strain NEG-M]